MVKPFTDMNGLSSSGWVAVVSENVKVDAWKINHNCCQHGSHTGIFYANTGFKLENSKSLLSNYLHKYAQYGLRRRQQERVLSFLCFFFFFFFEYFLEYQAVFNDVPFGF